MPFQKGHAKTGGKRTGCKNKITKDVVGLLNSLGCNPLEGLATIATDPKIKPELRAYCHAKLARFVYPELKSVEHSGPGGKPIEVDVTDHKQRLQQRVLDRVVKATS